MWIKIFAIFIFIFLIGSSPADATENVTFTIGNEQTVWDSTINYIPDQGYYIYHSGNKTYGVIGGSGSGVYKPTSPHSNYLITGDPLRNRITTDSLEEMGGLGPGKRGEFDEQGRWLASVWEDENGILYGFYHGERAWSNPQLGKNRNSTGYAKSTDGGKNWKLPDYPKNEVIRGYRLYGGDLRVIPVGNYLYMYYGESETNTQGSPYEIALARSLKSDRGKPGTWYKYYCKPSGSCGFSEPGLGGKYTPLNVKKSPGALFVVYNNYLNKFLAFGAQRFWAGPFLELYESDDGINWSFLARASLDEPQNGWGRIYAGIVSEEENSSEITGKSFWLYYTSAYNYSTDSRKRKLNRRKITLSKNQPSPTATPSTTLGASPTPKPGDANNDGKVDGVDYVIWLNHYNQSTNKGRVDGDFNKDTKVDGLDYVVWVNNAE